jgi:addiction module HigA family antidote
MTARKAPHWRVHPGEILREEFLKPLGISAYQLAKRLHVPAPRVNDIVLERRGMSAPILQSGSRASSEPRGSSG